MDRLTVRPAAHEPQALPLVPCPSCGRPDTRGALPSFLDTSRGTPLSLQGMNVVWWCPDCDHDRLRRWLDSTVPPPPDDLPINLR